MKLSIIYSIYNRSTLFKNGLESVIRQDFPKDDYEIIIVDDNSTGDLVRAYKPYIGTVNIRHIKYDHTKHPIWRELNPDGKEATWYHTQAISANIGIGLAKGEVICISQPEMIHSPHSLRTGYDRAIQYKAVFGEIIMGNDRLNGWITEQKQLPAFDIILDKAGEYGHEYTYSHMPEQQFYEMYWHILFCPTAVARQVGGVDLRYQGGVYAEDDQFKMRVRMAGCADVWGGRPACSGDVQSYIMGIHQSHMKEGEKIHRQNRQNAHWNAGAERNRALFRDFCANPYTVANSELDYDPFGGFLITKDDYHAI